MTESPDAGSSADAYRDPDSCFIETADYSQACMTNADCVSYVPLTSAVTPNGIHYASIPVFSGDYCESRCACSGSEMIGKAAVAQFVADVSKTPLGSGDIPFAVCSCPVPVPFPTVVCQDGYCLGVRPHETLDAGTDAGRE
jgi:hypothetical protein